MLQIVKTNLAKLANYPRLRIFLIIVGIVVIFVVTLNLLTPSQVKNSAPASRVQAVNTKDAKNQRDAPDNQTSQYNSLAATNQATTEQQAIKKGGSVFQNAFNPNQGNESNNDQVLSPQEFAASQAQKASQGKNAPPQDGLNQQISDLQEQLDSQEQRDAAERQNAAQMVAQQNAAAAARQQAVDQQTLTMQTAMQTGIQNLTQSWKLPTLATVQGTAPQGGAGNGAGGGTGPVAIKAGTILFGVISTALDSDNPGTPVLASIVTGPYKGAKLIGGFTATQTALVVQFNLMTLPSLSSSIPINAYAIDSKTANNAIATDVDNHYMLRYGMLFASGFLQGFGNAYQNYSYCPPGSQNCSVINTSGNSNLPSNTATTTTAAYQGLGQIGTNLSQVAAQQFNTPPTITVAQGTGIGVLFMSDVSLPVN